MSKRIATWAGVIQRENACSASGPGELQAGLLGHLAHGGAAVGEISLGVGRLRRVDGTAGEDPDAAHEPLGRIALDEQDLQRLAAFAGAKRPTAAPLWGRQWARWRQYERWCVPSPTWSRL